MAVPSYPFVDIVVLEAIRTRVARGDAMVVLSADLGNVVWANGGGAKLFGDGDLERFLGSDPTLGATVQRQIASAFASRRGQASIRMAHGFSSRIVGCEVERIALPHGEPAVLLAVRGEGPGDVRDAAVGGFSNSGTHVALLEGHGETIVASDGFTHLGIAPAQLRELVMQVRGEADRLVKRPLQTAHGALPAAIARLSERPWRYLLMVVEDAAVDEDEATTPAEDDFDARPAETSTTTILAAPPLVPGDDEDDEYDDTASAARRDHEHDSWYFDHEPARPSAANDSAPEQPPLDDGGDDGEDAASVDEPRLEDSDGGEGPVDTSPEQPDAEDDDGLAAAGTGFVHDPRSGPVRFVWKTAPDGTFRDISDEFAQAVGPNAADIIGRTFDEVSRVFDLDPSGEISELMQRRDTWSGRSVLWPVQGTDLKVPVDLAALPVYDRDRNFNGFRGFGVARMGDAMVDADAIGLTLAPSPRQTRADTGEDEPTEAGPQSEAPEPDEAPDASKVIDLGSRRRDRGEGKLTETEASAFRSIGEKLRSDTGEPEAAQDSDDTGEPDTGTEASNEAGAEAEEQQPEPKREDKIVANAPPIAREGFLPSAFAKGDGPGHAVLDEDVLALLPIAILVHDSKDVLYVNEEFLRLTGYRSLAAFRKAGGLDVLFSDSDEPVTPRFGAPVRLVTVSEETIPVEARLHSVRWRDTVSLLMSIRPLDESGEPAAYTMEVPGETPAQTVDPEPSALAAEPVPEVTPEPVQDAAREAAHAGDDDSAGMAEARELRAILDTATDGVVLLDRHGRIRSLNRSAQALFGYEDTEMVGEPFQMLFAIESRPAANDYLQSLADNGITSVLNDGRELIACEKQGRFIPVFMTMGRLQESSGYCAVLRDITQFKRTEMELEHARKKAEKASEQKSEFLARVSHEVRTPLNAIIGFSEIMLAESYGPIGNERYRDYLADINTSGNHVLQIINDLLDISKIEAGQQDLDYEAVPLNDVISECVSIMQPAANRERVIVRTSLSPSVPDVVADLRSMRQIVLNLLSNAIRYTQSGGQIIVSTTYDSEGEVVMRVRDTGVGMSDAEIEQALKPFKQVPTAKGRVSGGTGLGLPLTKAMAEANRALFAIRSAPGEGTVVSVTFPPQRVLAD
ncbi:MAG: PAS domain S-box protein [Brucellaceae bacterium]|nr:PAS domain S-box protein [Brucellaceae bacterium]